MGGKDQHCPWCQAALECNSWLPAWWQFFKQGKNDLRHHVETPLRWHQFSRAKLACPACKKEMRWTWVQEDRRKIWLWLSVLLGLPFLAALLFWGIRPLMARGISECVRQNPGLHADCSEWVLMISILVMVGSFSGFFLLALSRLRKLQKLVRAEEEGAALPASIHR